MELLFGIYGRCFLAVGDILWVYFVLFTGPVTEPFVLLNGPVAECLRLAVGPAKKCF